MKGSVNAKKWNENGPGTETTRLVEANIGHLWYRAGVGCVQLNVCNKAGGQLRDNLDVNV
jgi:hypothetical protein